MAWLPGHGVRWQFCCGCRCEPPSLPCLRVLRAAGLSAVQALLLLLLLLLHLLRLLLLRMLLLWLVVCAHVSFPGMERRRARCAALRALLRSSGRGSGARKCFIIR